MSKSSSKPCNPMAKQLRSFGKRVVKSKKSYTRKGKKTWKNAE